MSYTAWLVGDLLGGSLLPSDTWYRHGRHPWPPPCWVWTSWCDVEILLCLTASVSWPDFWLDHLNWYSSLCSVAAPFYYSTHIICTLNYQNKDITILCMYKISNTVNQLLFVLFFREVSESENFSLQTNPLSIVFITIRLDKAGSRT